MSCQSVQDRLSEFLDRLLADEERENVPLIAVSHAEKLEYWEPLNQ